VRLSIRLLEEGQPGLLRVLALSKVKGTAVGLKDATIGLICINTLDVIEENSVKTALIVIRLDKIKLGFVSACVAEDKRDTYEIVNNLGNPCAITVKDKPVDTHILVMSNTELLNQTSLLTKRAQSSHEPTVSITPLSNIIGSRAVDVEARLVKDVTNTLNTLRRKIQTGLVTCYIR
jgi:hypothetical protein